jgi:hypothetical protein
VAMARSGTGASKGWRPRRTGPAAAAGLSMANCTSPPATARIPAGESLAKRAMGAGAFALLPQLDVRLRMRPVVCSYQGRCDLQHQQRTNGACERSIGGQGPAVKAGLI